VCIIILKLLRKSTVNVNYTDTSMR